MPYIRGLTVIQSVERLPILDKCHCTHSTAYYLCIVTKTYAYQALLGGYYVALLTHWDWDKMAVICLTTYFEGFSWMEMYEFRISLKFVIMGPINNIPALVQIIDWRLLIINTYFLLITFLSPIQILIYVQHFYLCIWYYVTLNNTIMQFDCINTITSVLCEVASLLSNTENVIHLDIVIVFLSYHKISNISHTKSQNLNESRFVLQLSLPNPLKPGVKLRMKM